MEEFDSNYLAWILYKLFYGIDKEVAKNKERSYVEIDLSNNCKYDVFYNYVKILNLMTLLIERFSRSTRSLFSRYFIHSLG